MSVIIIGHNLPFYLYPTLYLCAVIELFGDVRVLMRAALTVALIFSFFTNFYFN